MLAKITQRIKFYKLPILSGLLIGTSYAPLPPWASLFALVPLWLFWTQNRQSAGKIIFAGWLTGFFLTLVGFNWIAHVAQVFGQFPTPVAYIVLILYSALANIHIAVAGLIWWALGRYLKLKQPLHWLSLPIISAFCHNHLQFIFEWNYGYSFYWVRWPIYQLAEIIGFRGISDIVFLFNLIFLLIYTQTDKTKRMRVFAAAVACFLSLNFLGYLLPKNLPKPDAQLNIGIVQANIGNLESARAEHGPMFRSHILGSYSELSQELIRRSPTLDFIVWPETAFPSTIYDGNDGDFHVRQLKRFVKSINTPLITGGYGYNVEKSRYTNGFYVLNQDGEFHNQHYIKTHLLAFGEFIPLGETFPLLKKWIPAADFLAGDGAKTILYNGFSIGPQICYESLYPDFSRELAHQGADFIVNLTNDSWYGPWQEPYQHLIMTLARAVELRMPLIRSTNTGISTVVLADGSILEKSPFGKKSAVHYEVPYLKNKKATFFQSFPWLMSLIFVSAFIGLLLMHFYSSRER